jgi:hypothetical protein
VSMTEELERLGRLHKDGTLSDEEFPQAKAKLLSEPAGAGLSGQDRSLGEAANRYVSLQIVMAVIGFIVFLIIVFGVILSKMSGSSGVEIHGAPIVLPR